MPVYVYHCGSCEFEFEQQQKFTDKPLKICPECGQSNLNKVYTPVGVIYKGSGFYSTDHRSSSSSLSYSKGKKEEKKEGTAPEEKKVRQRRRRKANLKKPSPPQPAPWIDPLSRLYPMNAHQALTETLPRNLGNGLTLRSSSPEDIDRLVEFFVRYLARMRVISLRTLDSGCAIY